MFFSRKPRSIQPHAWFLTRFLRHFVLRPFTRLKLFATHTVSGKGFIPKRGGVIVACNHPSYWDSVALAIALDRNTTFLAKAELWRNPLARWLLNTLGQIPVDRGNRESGGKAQVLALKVLTHRNKQRQDKGGQVIIFPEGGCTPHDGPNAGVMRDFKSGVWHIALRSGVPVVPAHIKGTNLIKLHFRRIILRKQRPHIDIRLGKPLFAAQFTGATAKEDFLQELRRRILALSET